MIFRHNIASIKTPRSLLALAIGSSLSLSAFNTSAAEEKNAADQEIETIQVTGSRIQRTDIESAKPVTIITAIDIANSGLNSIADVLAASIFNSAGASIGVANNSWGNHASTDLRGLGSNRTLTLLNGRRAAKGAATGGDSFNLNMLPLAAVERIDILRDGASSIYGSDAMGGVINIITKDDYEGLNITVNGQNAARGGMDRSGGSITMGTSTEKSSLLISLEHQFKGGLKGGERDHISGETNPSRIFGYGPYATWFIQDRDEGYTWGDDTPGPNCPEEMIRDSKYGQQCSYDTYDGKTYIPTSKKDSILTNFKYQVSDELEFYNTILYVSNKTESSGTAMWWNDEDLTMAAENPNNPTYQTPGVVNPYSDTAYDVAFSHRMDGAVDRNFIYDTNLLDINTGIRLDLDAGNLSVNLSHSRDSFINQVDSYYFMDKFKEAVDNGDYNPFEYAGGANATPEVIDSFTHDFYRVGESTTQGITIDWSGLTYELAGGAIGYAIGTEYREVELTDEQDHQSKAGNVKGVFGGDTVGGYDYKSIYGEIELPVTETLIITAASRYDSYSFPDESQVSSSVGAAWDAMDDLKLRASWSQGFRVGTMADISGDESLSNESVVDTTWCRTIPIEDRPGATECGSRSRPISYIANPDLEPETSEQISFGLAYNITEDIGLTVDYWSIEIDNEISTVSAQNILIEEADGNLAEWGSDLTVDRDLTADDWRGELQGFTSLVTNFVGRDTSGLDVALNAHFDLGDMGNLNVAFESSYIIEYNRKMTTTLPEYDYVGFTGRPEWRGALNLNYSYENISAFLNTKYIEGTKGETPQEFEAGEEWQDFGTMVTIDFGISYDTDGYGKISYIMRNVGDRLPDVNTDLRAGYNERLHSIVGRTNQLNWSIDF